MKAFKVYVPVLVAAAIMIALLALPGHTESMVSANVDKLEPGLSSANSAAHIVIQYAPTDQIVRSVQVSDPMTGLEALQNSGLDVLTLDLDWGIAVCSIGGVGCPVDDCFCSEKFWSYEFWDGSEWQGHPVGASDSSVEAGNVEGWRWTEWGVGGLAPAPTFLAADRALNWLAAQQGDDGSYGNISSDVESLLAIGANDFTAGQWRKSPETRALSAPIILEGPAFTEAGAGQSGKFASGLVAASGCKPYQAVAPSTYYNPESGLYDEGIFNHSWAILGVMSMEETVPPEAMDYLRDQVQPNGGWAFSPGFGADTNTTALVIQALIAAHEDPDSDLILNGLGFLKSAQNDDGGFTYDPDSEWGTNSDTNSTAYAIQAILATGQDPATGMWVVGDTNPINYLTGMQLPDGSFEWQTGIGSNLMATQQAIPALLGRVMPLKMAAAVDACPLQFFPLFTQ